MKRTFILSLIFLLSGVLFANPIDRQKALEVAKNFHSSKFRTPSTNITLAYECTSKGNTRNVSSDEQTYYYIFNTDNGFIIISGDDSVYPILGYSDAGNKFEENKRMPSFNKWMDNYRDQISYAMNHNVEATPEVKAQWEAITNGSGELAVSRSSVSPMIQVWWGQDPYVNNLCPYDHTYNERTVTGCPATAMAQIMKYWEYPAQGTGSHSYNEPHYGKLSANFGATTYDWGNMPSRVNSSEDAESVAILMYHCGVAVEMAYGVAETGGSGSFLIEDGFPRNRTCENAYKTYFGYDSTTLQGLYRRNFSDKKWIKLLKKELDEGRPIQYAGYSNHGGHTFIFDGYDSKNRFHVNWGWAGALDGYYLIDKLTPGAGNTGAGGGSFNRGQQAIIGIQPGGNVDRAKLVIDKELSLDPKKIERGQGFKLSTRVKNTGEKTFEGEISAAIVNEDMEALTLIETQIGILKKDFSTPLNLHFEGSKEILPGKYSVVLVYRPEGDEEWKIVADNDDDSYYNSIELEVVSGNEIAVVSNIKVSTGNIEINKPFEIYATIKNNDFKHFAGQIKLALYETHSTNMVKEIDTETVYFIEADGGTKDMRFSSYHGIDVNPGTYNLAIAHKKDGVYEWTICGTENGYKNPVQVRVIGKGVNPEDGKDIYENNDSEYTAYTLSPNFSNNKANVNTQGSNLHNGTDKDYYKINLASGYNYSIKARVHDKNTSSKYTNDVVWSYKVDNETWSKEYDVDNYNDIKVQDGGTVKFLVLPYTSGVRGSYLLDIEISRTSIDGGDEDNDPEYYTISTSVSPNSNAGYVSGAGEYKEGSTVKLEAIASYGYKFEKWTENGYKVSSSENFVFTASKDKSLVAHFIKKNDDGNDDNDKKYYTISTSISPNHNAGYVSGAGEYKAGSTVKLEAISGYGYKFEKWTEDGYKVSSSENFVFTASKDRSLVAHFRKINGGSDDNNGDDDKASYTIKASAQLYSTGTVFGAGEYKKGEQVTISAMPFFGHKFEKWLENGSVVSTDSEYTFTVNRDRNLIAVFVEDNFSSAFNSTKAIESVRVYPNPTIQYINIELSSAITGNDNVNVVLTDIFGKSSTVNNFSIVENKITFDVSNKIAGIYYIQLTIDGKESKTERIVIE